MYKTFKWKRLQRICACTFQIFLITCPAEKKKARTKSKIDPKKTFFSRQQFYKYRRYLYTYRRYLHKHRRYLYMHRRYVKNYCLEMKVFIGASGVYLGTKGTYNIMYNNMEITLPLHINQTQMRVETRTLVVIGTNGAGKSSFGRDLLKRYPERAQNISGLHALFMSNSSEDVHWMQQQPLLQERLLLPRMTAYERLILRLQHEEFEAAVDYKEACKKTPGLTPPITKIDLIQTLWEEMFPQNRLVRKSGFIELTSTSRTGDSYTAGRMSDSEKLVFYLIGAILYAPQEALLIVEEPETLLHTSIKNLLWDRIEQLRPDCSFVYLTHDIDFALSRHASKRLWIRSYDADHQLWDYELIENNRNLPEELYMEILGSRKPILFIEGTETNSIDNRLYSQVFPDYLVKPMGGCQKVIETTKAFNSLKDFHTLESMGIVDRDRRTEAEIAYLHEQHIYVPNVAEVENLLLLEEVIKTVAARLMKKPDAIFTTVKQNVIRLFAKDMEEQVILHAKHQVRKKLEMALNVKIHSFEQLSERVEEIHEHIQTDAIYRHIKQTFQSYIDTADYESILRVYNQKGILPQSRLCGLCGISSKEHYLEFILSILQEGKEDAEVIRRAIKRSLGMEEKP